MATLALAAGFAHGAHGAGFDSDPFFYDPAFNSNGIYVDGIAGANGACLEQRCDGMRVARLSNGDIVTAVELYSFQSDGVGGGSQSDGDFALVRYNAAGQRVAWSAPTAAYAHYNNQYLLWPNNDTSAGRMVSHVVDVKAVNGYIYVMFEYTDASDSSNNDTRTGLTVFNEAGQWKQTRYRLLCQIGECSDNGLGLAVVAEYGEPVRLLAVASTWIYGDLANRGVKTKGMTLASDGIAWDDPDFGDANSRNFFSIPTTLCRPEVRPCAFSLRRVTTAVDHPDYDSTTLYLVGDVKWNNSSDINDPDNNVLVVKMNRLGYPVTSFGTGGFQSIAFNADGKWNDKGAAIVAEGSTDQGGDYHGNVYVAANVGQYSVGLTKLDGATGAVVTSFGTGGLSIKGGRHCDVPGCVFINFPEAAAYAMAKEGDRLVVVGTKPSTGIDNVRIAPPLFAVARAGDGRFTEFAQKPVPGGDATFLDVLALGDGRYAISGSAYPTGGGRLAVTARLRADRIFGDGVDP